MKPCTLYIKLIWLILIFDLILQYNGCNNGKLFAVAKELRDADREKGGKMEWQRQKVKKKDIQRTTRLCREKKKQYQWLKQGKRVRVRVQHLQSMSFFCLIIWVCICEWVCVCVYTLYVWNWKWTNFALKLHLFLYITTDN